PFLEDPLARRQLLTQELAAFDMASGDIEERALVGVGDLPHQAGDLGIGQLAIGAGHHAASRLASHSRTSPTRHAGMRSLNWTGAGKLPSFTLRHSVMPLNGTRASTWRLRR